MQTIALCVMVRAGVLWRQKKSLPRGGQGKKQVQDVCKEFRGGGHTEVFDELLQVVAPLAI